MNKLLKTINFAIKKVASRGSSTFNVLTLAAGSLLLLTACEPPTARQQAIKNYATDMQPSQYASLVQEDPETLSTEQLYNRALTLWGDDYTELRIPTSFGEAQVVVSGPADGYPLILLHGMNTNSTMWYPNVPWLARHYKIYAIDYLLGSGKSESNKDIADIAQVMAWYNEIFNALELKQFALIGASQGGWFATQIALNEPAKVSQLVLLSPAQTFAWITPSLDALKSVYFLFNPKRSELRAMLQTMSTNVDNIDQLYIDHFYRYSATNKSLPDLLSQMTPFADDKLRRLAMPTLVLIGDQDIINTAQSLKQAQQVLPCVETAIVANAGHFLNVDNADSVNKRVHQFINATKKDNSCNN
ncbi:alpha/beta hydrolase [Rheinheimera sp. MMS21-TC3]|uniref:alpha/beta fold hydrolase n=1 Tax=Rheinheimera sp. MMS21-TC3 TaxID=3072790 RepID=UPI0028C41F36|nr:alpha/beta hydrolase [Rheinheimera sp. MMS21-TC3]WNO59739.1 alpha/beta hydrolase [Rheinheimera sp. MMS21-TC3]